MDASDNGPAWASFHGNTGLRHTPERAERPECEGPQKMPGTEVGQARHRRIAPPSGSGVGLVGQGWHGTGKDQPNGQQMAGLSTLGGGMPITAGTATQYRAWPESPFLPVTIVLNPCSLSRKSSLTH